MVDKFQHYTKELDVFGSFFQKTTGKPVSDMDTMMAVEEAVEKACGHKLQVKKFESNLISERGNVFPFTDPPEAINQRIDAALKRF